MNDEHGLWREERERAKRAEERERVLRADVASLTRERDHGLRVFAEMVTAARLHAEGLERERDDYKRAWQRDMEKGRGFLAERDDARWAAKLLVDAYDRNCTPLAAAVEMARSFPVDPLRSGR